ncbi:EF-P beta-lysylation protein EpmB [Rhodopirellula bahusiensis]|uniref:L-lysine 2,3-aminomutase n=1 Tax=Rhodopirellula bahusiensis TaxID=2014065 RepID=A0A2G1VYR8_9BACT|nr:EF-P beta-lysylation protein EpmB [Rhodopirellula bahusiensis]PHQ31936.1 EF-P beta-lysylation protein EpmB [Rhodopirellula bahusiensis]
MNRVLEGNVRGGSLTAKTEFVPVGEPLRNEGSDDVFVQKHDELKQESLQTKTQPETADWRGSMKRAIRSVGVLRRHLNLPSLEGDSGGSLADDHGFPVFVPLEFAARMKPGDPNDPLLRQVLPLPEEAESPEGFSSDPVGDLNAAVAPGLLHKYHGRALAITTGACGIHCRYCFRREFPYSENSSRGNHLDLALKYLRENDSIEEVLLSGGDPLTLTDDSVAKLMQQIEAIPHVRRLRWHTRMPIVIPSRVTDSWIENMRASRLTSWVVVHCNHPAELDDETGAALMRLVDAGIPVLNQAVLLREINDDVDVLESLCRRLIDLRVMPYYLHQLDRVRGAAHFEVDQERGRALISQLESRLPGFAVPRFVCEQAGQASKTRL